MVGVRVVVVGGGVVGVGTSLALLQRHPHCHLTIMADHFSPHTTGDGAAGLWGPYLNHGTSPHDIIRWSGETWQVMSEWWRAGRGREMGVSLVHGTCLARDDLPLDPWHHLPLAYHHLTQDQCAMYGSHYRSGTRFGSMTAEVRKFLPVLQAEVEALGGRLEVRRLASLHEAAAEADLVINCSGLGARDLVPDHTVYPCRGQVMRVRAPWVGEFLCDESHESFAYILPNQDSVVLGGTHQDHDWRTLPDPDDTATIWSNCTAMLPSLKMSEVVEEWVGLRPAREGGVRLQADQLTLPSRTVPVVHNYGHGGCGITMFWGCSQEAAAIASNLIYKHYGPPNKL